MKRFRVAVIVGTRPEAIKMAPVIRALSASELLSPITLSTSQHRHMVHQIFGTFGIRRYHDLRVMRPGQTLWDLSGRLAARLGRFFEANHVDAALVQGDTSSAFFGGLCAFYHQIPVGHVEAGLRTGDRYSPFPEEMNRTLLGSLATWHFAPTRDAVNRPRRDYAELEAGSKRHPLRAARLRPVPLLSPARLSRYLRFRRRAGRSHGSRQAGAGVAPGN